MSLYVWGAGGGGVTKPPLTENHYSKFTLNIYKYLDHKLNNDLLFHFICYWGNLCPKQFLKSSEMQFSYVLSRSQMFCEIRRIFQNFQKLESRNLDHSWDQGEASKVFASFTLHSQGVALTAYTGVRLPVLYPSLCAISW